MARSAGPSLRHEGGTSIAIWAASAENIRDIARALRFGALVGMPTETVYGIAANAFNEDAVRRTFEIKGRPSDNPLIVHLSGLEQMGLVASEWSSAAEALAERFWPGPLTLVVPKTSEISDAVTAGLRTVAVRVPSHPVALALLREVAVPISAPSANRFTRLSPTRAEEIDPEIARELFAILDGGPCSVGIESTVVDVSTDQPRMLRPGGISRTQIEDVVGPLSRPSEGPRSSPGMYPRHYAPTTPVRCAERLAESDAGICLGVPASACQIRLPGNPDGYAAGLYSALYELDRSGGAEIVIEAPPVGPEWEAVWDRLKKAGCSYPNAHG